MGIGLEGFIYNSKKLSNNLNNFPWLWNVCFLAFFFFFLSFFFLLTGNLEDKAKWPLIQRWPANLFWLFPPFLKYIYSLGCSVAPENWRLPHPRVIFGQISWCVTGALPAKLPHTAVGFAVRSEGPLLGHHGNQKWRCKATCGGWQKWIIKCVLLLYVVQLERVILRT
jgi:hypothetical protein